LKKIRIVIADGNRDYLESLAAFIRNSKSSSQFIVSYFSSLDTLNSYIEQGDMVDILLISSDMYQRDIPRLNEMLIILLEDDTLATNNQSLPSIYRYQRLDQLVGDILGLYYETNEDAGKLLMRNSQTKIISVYSPVGGTGKTTVAVNLAKQIALNDAKVFYLNLETFNTTKLFLTDDQDDSSLQIFYYAKTASNQLLSKIEKLKKYDTQAMVDFFDIEINAQEMLELTNAEIERIINGLLEIGSYDYIIMDLDSSIHERNITAMRESDLVLWVVSNDHLGLLKTKAFLDEEVRIFGKENAVKDKMSIIVNKFNGNLIGDYNEAELSVEGYLPFIQNWIQFQSKSELLGNDDFNREVQMIIRKLIMPEQEGVPHSGL
jgi:cellulose biosynthesis protein BcsQ